LLHTKTWFELAPKAAIIIVNSEEDGARADRQSALGVTRGRQLVILAVALLL
jgi:fumarate reductase subunit C